MGLVKQAIRLGTNHSKATGKSYRENTARTVGNLSANVAGATLNSGRKILVSDRGVPQM